MNINDSSILLKQIEQRQNEINKMSNYLKELESQLSLIFAASPDLLVISNVSGDIIKVNNASKKILGYKPEILVGKSVWDFVHPDDVEATKNIKKEMFQNNLTFFENKRYFLNRWKRNDGSYAKLAWKFAFYENEKKYYIKFAADISEFEIENPHSLKLVNYVVKYSRDGIVITDVTHDNVIIYANLAFQKITGYSLDDLINKNCRLLQGDARDQKALEYLRYSIKNGLGCESLLYNKRKNGEPFFNHLIISPIYEDGILHNYIGVARDVTDLINQNPGMWDINSNSGFKNYELPLYKSNETLSLPLYYSI